MRSPAHPTRSTAHTAEIPPTAPEAPPLTRRPRCSCRTRCAHTGPGPLPPRGRIALPPLPRAALLLGPPPPSGDLKRPMRKAAGAFAALPWRQAPPPSGGGRRDWPRGNCRPGATGSLSGSGNHQSRQARAAEVAAWVSSPVPACCRGCVFFLFLFCLKNPNQHHNH